MEESESRERDSHHKSSNTNSSLRNDILISAIAHRVTAEQTTMTITITIENHRCKKTFFTFFYIKNAFLTFLFLERFYFLVEKFLMLINPLKSY